MNVFVERVKAKQVGAEAKLEANRERCEKFLLAVEAEEQAAWGFYEQYGVMPGNAGHEQATAKARARLTELELHCPGRLHRAAQELVDLLEGSASGDKQVDDYREARKNFIRVFHQKL